MASVATGGGGGGDRDNDGNRKPVKPHYRHQETLVTPNKASRRRKSRDRSQSESPESTATSTGAAKAAASQDGDAVEKVQQQTNGKKPRLVWTPELHDKFVIACKNLGKDAVPTKILAAMNVDGLTRENVASHLQFYDATTAAELQKYRNNLKGKGQSVSRRGNNGGGKMTPRRQQEDFPPQAQPVQQASSSVNPPPPPLPQGSSLHPQIGHGHLVQALPTLVHQQPHQVMLEPMPQLLYPLQQQQFQASTEQQKRMVMEQQQAAWMNKQAAAAGPGHNHHELVAQTTLAGAPASGVQSLPQMQVGHAVNMGAGAGLYSVRVASMRDEQREIHMVMPQQQIPVEAEARQLPAAEPAFAGFANSDGAQEEDESCDIQHFWNPGSGPSIDHDFPPPIKPI